VPNERLARLKEVEGMAGCGKSTIYEMMRAGKFPKSVRLNARTVAWPVSAVQQWIQDRIAESQAAQAKAESQAAQAKGGVQ